MSKSKKSTFLLAVLLIAMGVFAFLDKEISILEYGCLYINAVLYLGLVYHSESLCDTLEIFIEMQDGLIRALRKRIEVLDNLVYALKVKNKSLEDMMEIRYGKHEGGTAD